MRFVVVPVDRSSYILNKIKRKTIWKRLITQVISWSRWAPCEEPFVSSNEDPILYWYRCGDILGAFKSKFNFTHIEHHLWTMEQSFKCARRTTKARAHPRTTVTISIAVCMAPIWLIQESFNGSSPQHLRLLNLICQLVCNKSSCAAYKMWKS